MNQLLDDTLLVALSFLTMAELIVIEALCRRFRYLIMRLFNGTNGKRNYFRRLWGLGHEVTVQDFRLQRLKMPFYGGIDPIQVKGDGYIVHRYMKPNSSGRIYEFGRRVRVPIIPPVEHATNTYYYLVPFKKKWRLAAIERQLSSVSYLTIRPKRKKFKKWLPVAELYPNITENWWEYIERPFLIEKELVAMMDVVIRSD